MFLFLFFYLVFVFLVSHRVCGEKSIVVNLFIGSIAFNKGD